MRFNAMRCNAIKPNSERQGEDRAEPNKAHTTGLDVHRTVRFVRKRREVQKDGFEDQLQRVNRRLGLLAHVISQLGLRELRRVNVLLDKLLGEHRRSETSKGIFRCAGPTGRVASVVLVAPRLIT